MDRCINLNAERLKGMAANTMGVLLLSGLLSHGFRGAESSVLRTKCL